ncbi:hypothetical protein [Endozoicomonas sp.]|uniref:hypothetical protein n=1 Tax=Endozoicomonas sp. TaxID=1892382 RepID=UPI0028852DB3|nr:hypothetical protein [Endozoicomonas sp.]
MTLNKMNLLGCIFCLSISPVYAINKSTVVNKTDQTIAVVWTALGCLHREYSHGQVCAGRLLDPGHSHRYQYNWGATNDNVHIGGYLPVAHTYVVTGSSVVLDPNVPVSQKISGNCKFPSINGATVYVTSIDIDSNRLELNCQFDIHRPFSIYSLTSSVTEDDGCNEEAASQETWTSRCAD